MGVDSSDMAARPSRVLIADLDPGVLSRTTRVLRSANFDVAAVSDPAHALKMLDGRRFDLLVLDAAMLGNWLAALRARARAPIIVSGASVAEADVIRAFNLGADDYVTKSLGESALLARIRAILRRSAMTDATLLCVDDAALDIASQQLTLGATALPLTRLETLLLRALFASAGRAVSAERLALEGWGKAQSEQLHALKQVVYRLRRKLTKVSPFAGKLQTSRSAGYRWRSTPEKESPARGGASSFEP